MKDIAKRARVAPCTVSRALRNDPSVKKQTRERILKAVQQLGYRPNPLVKALMSRVRKALPKQIQPIIAYITVFPEKHSWKAYNSHTKFYEGAKRRCEIMGFKLEHFWLGDVDMNWPRLGQILYARNIYGLILAPLPSSGMEIDFPWKHFAAAAIGYTSRQVPLHRASINQFYNCQIVLDRLTRLGYRRLGLVLYNIEDIRVAHHFRGALYLYQNEIPIEDRLEPHLPQSLTREGFLKWCQEQKPDAVITLDPNIREWIQEAEGDLCRDIAVASLGIGSVRVGGYAGMDAKPYEVGAAAVDLVVLQLNGNEFGLPQTPKTVLIDGAWVEGNTAPPKLAISISRRECTPFQLDEL